MTELLADRYKLRDELGSRGMGRVVRAHGLGGDVAINLLHPTLVR